MPQRTNLKSLSPDGLATFVAGMGLPRYRAEQILHWIYGRCALGIGDITELSRDLRRDLEGSAYISSLVIRDRKLSSDGTEKFLFGLEDGETIESVLIPDEDRLTLCISSQVGCGMGCRFCLTGQMGLKRNLRAFEIVDQVTAVTREIAPRRKITNIVLMGMGEPLANLTEVAEALRRITSLIGMSKRRITLSTAGLADRLKVLAESAPEVNLAVSLNATTDSVRDAIMPVNRKHPIRQLLDACRAYPLSPHRRITFEYVMLSGVNDSPEDARRLSRLVKGIRCKINLIPYNPHEGSEYARPSGKRVLAFQKVLTDSGLTVLIRESKGQDILAACGQLKAALAPRKVPAQR